ncbi:MAG: ribonuclease H family protein, partial [Clostridiaceae bacterium]
MAKKYYAVVGGKEGSAIYLTWDETKANVDGISKVKYKAFGDYSEAERFITSTGVKKEDIHFNSSSVNKIKVKPEVKGPFSEDSEDSDELIAYVDGSFRQGFEVYGYGVVLIYKGKVLDTLSGFGKKAKYVSMRNVAGEVLG